MDFELIDEMRPFASEQARREVDRRLALITTELAKELQGRGMYRVLDRAPAAQLIERLKASHEPATAPLRGSGRADRPCPERPNALASA